ncbi:MAG: NMD3-related protein [Methanomassiliicoccaceae archaeon]|nr:NMD3-related protein [Methanomassiliicoccaceae archaeon]
MFCVKCNKEEETFDGLCIECFLDGKKLITLPHHVDMERCASCHEYRLSGRWMKRTEEEAIEDAALNSIKALGDLRITNAYASAEGQDEWNYSVTVYTEGELNGRAVKASSGTVVRIKNGVCQKCSRQLGNYYEATLQIRSGSRKLSDSIRDGTVRYVRDRIEHLSSTNRQLFLTKVEEVQGGVDMLLSSISLAKTLAKELSDMYGAETKEASKLIGRTEDGTDMYRMTYLVRMPEYHLNDIVIFEGEAYKLSGIGKGIGKLTRLEDLHVTSVRRSRMHEMKVHTPHDKITKATVVSRSKGEAQILHPVSYATMDVRVPDDADITETMDIAEIDGVVFYVP